MTYDEALCLWSSIIDVAMRSYELGAEGNSGEFHSPKDYKRLERDLKKEITFLASTFHKNTGFLPTTTCKEAENMLYYLSWELERK